MRALCLLLVICIGLADPGRAAPIEYQLDAQGSVVGFEADFGQNLIRGTMPVRTADLVLDFNRVAGSHINVTLNVGRAKTNLPFATVAMKGPSVLDTRDHPEIRFESTKIRSTGAGAAITGRLTVRGITRDITLAAQFYRPKGSAKGERDTLSILLTGTVSRAAFGAVGFSDLVGDEVRLKILARIRRGG